MEWLKRIGRQLLFPHLGLVIISVPVAAALLIYTFLYVAEMCIRDRSEAIKSS